MPRFAQNCPECPDLPKMPRFAQNAQICPELPRFAQNAQNAQICPELPKKPFLCVRFAHFGPILTGLIRTDKQKISKINGR